MEKDRKPATEGLMISACKLREVFSVMPQEFLLSTGPLKKRRCFGGPLRPFGVPRCFRVQSHVRSLHGSPDTRIVLKMSSRVKLNPHYPTMAGLEILGTDLCEFIDWLIGLHHSEVFYFCPDGDRRKKIPLFYFTNYAI